MTNSWLRLWHDMPNDPKWRTIARVSGTSIPEVISVYIHILVEASNATERGRTQPNIEDISSALDVSFERVQSIVDAMQGRVIEGDKLTGWEKRQPQREDNSADRAKRWREEQKRTQANANERKRTLEKRREEESREEETNTSASTAHAVPASPPFIAFPLTQGKKHIITENDVQAYREAYPAVDVRQELREVCQWLDAHPDKRSHSVKGSKQRIVRWLGKEQDKGGVKSNARPDAVLERQKQNLANIEAAARRLEGSDGAGGGFLSQSNASSGNARRVPDGVGRDREEVWDEPLSERPVERSASLGLLSIAEGYRGRM